MVTNQPVFGRTVSCRLAAAICLMGLIGACKPAAGLAGKTPGTFPDSGSSPRSAKSGESNGSDDALVSEDQRAVPPEVVTGHYLTCEPLPALPSGQSGRSGSSLSSGPSGSSDGDSQLTLGCAAFDSGRRVPLQADVTKWYASKDLEKASGTEITGTGDGSGTFDSLLTIARTILAQNTYIKAVVAAAAADTEQIYAMKIAAISDRMTVFRATTLQEEGPENAGFQLAGEGRFELHFKTGNIKVIPTTKVIQPSKITSVAVRLKIASTLSEGVRTHDFLWDPTGKETTGTVLPGAGGSLWKNLQPTKKGAVPFEIISYSDCAKCPVKKGTGPASKPAIKASIDDTRLTIDFSLSGGQVYGIAMDIPVRSI